MSEYPSESQIRSWNNDGMEPDWRPEPITFTSEPLEKIKKFILSCDSLVEILKKIPKSESTDKNKHVITYYQVTIADRMAEEIVAAYEPVKFNRG